MNAPTIAHQRGKCRICGCTVLNPCLDDNGIACAWMDREQTLCDNLECIGPRLDRRTAGNAAADHHGASPMKWKITVTHFTPLTQPQEYEQVYEIEAPTAADAITICNLRHAYPWQGTVGTASAQDSARITDCEPIAEKPFNSKPLFSGGVWI